MTPLRIRISLRRSSLLLTLMVHLRSSQATLSPTTTPVHPTTVRYLPLQIIYTHLTPHSNPLGAGTCSTTGGANGWLCQHRFIAITGMVGFHNTVGSATMNNWVSPQSQQIAFGRGSLGYVAINNANSAWSSTFTTALPDGTYCDVISGKSNGGSCSGSS